jgi:hypothetical protein
VHELVCEYECVWLPLLQQVHFAGAKEAQVAHTQPEDRVLLAVCSHLHALFIAASRNWQSACMQLMSSRGDDKRRTLRTQTRNPQEPSGYVRLGINTCMLRNDTAAAVSVQTGIH